MNGDNQSSLGAGHPEISAVVPVVRLFDESGVLVKEYIDMLAKTGKPFELIYVLDGEHKQLLARLSEIAAQERRLRVIQLAKNFGEASALTAGFANSSGAIILTLPAYPQVEVSDIPKLIEEVSICDVATAERVSLSQSGARFGTTRRRWFHWLVRVATGQSFRDMGCGVRALKHSVVDELPLYGDQYRFFPVLAQRRGFRVNEVAVREAPKDTIVDRHGISDYLARLLDIVALIFLTRFTKKPLRFFGTVGGVVFAVGALIVVELVFERLFMSVALADRPALLLASLMVVLGLQIFALGLLGELIIFTHARSIKEYTIEKIVNE